MDIVLDIQEDKYCVRLYTEGGECLSFCRALWRKAPDLRPGSPIDVEELKHWMLLEQYPHALHYAVDLLAKQPRSAGEIRAKLRLRHDSEDTIEMVLYKLEKEKLLDDAAFAEQYAAARARRQYGEARIRRALLQKGVSKEIIDNALAQSDAEEQEKAALALARKLMKQYEREENPLKAKVKLMAAMARRGYAYEESKAALDKAREEDAWA